MSLLSEHGRVQSEIWRHLGRLKRILFLQDLLRSEAAGTFSTSPEDPGSTSWPFLEATSVFSADLEASIQQSVGDQLRQNEEHHLSDAATWILLHQKNLLHRPLSSIKGRGSIQSKHSILN